MTDYYKDMELIYKPAVQKLRDDMKRIGELANQIYAIAKAHDYPEIATPSPMQNAEDSAPVAPEFSGASGAATALPPVWGDDGFPFHVPTEPLRPAPPVTIGKVKYPITEDMLDAGYFELMMRDTQIDPVNTVERIYTAMRDVYEQVDLDNERKGD